jgi:hypothetical protein
MLFFFYLPVDAKQALLIDILRIHFLAEILSRRLGLRIVRAHLYVCPLLQLIYRKEILCSRNSLFNVKDKKLKSVRI